MRQKVILLGGPCGSGKSTLTDDVIEHYGHGTNLDFDNINRKEGGMDPNELEKSKSIVERIAEKDFPDALAKAVAEGDPLIIAAATFLPREQRDTVLKRLEPYKDHVDIYPLIMMLPQSETIKRIKEGRIGNTHLINDQTVHHFYEEANRDFRLHTHTDLLLPSNRKFIPNEYREMLNENEKNKRLLNHPELDYKEKRKWVVVTRPLTITDITTILNQAPEPRALRGSLEGRRINFEGRENRTILPPAYRK